MSIRTNAERTAPAALPLESRRTTARAKVLQPVALFDVLCDEGEATYGKVIYFDDHRSRRLRSTRNAGRASAAEVAAADGGQSGDGEQSDSSGEQSDSSGEQSDDSTEQSGEWVSTRSGGTIHRIGSAVTLRLFGRTCATDVTPQVRSTSRRRA